MFSVVTVDETRSESLEPLGTKRKFWYRDNERRMLFKAEDRGTGEDWAERVVCELCVSLRLPHVHYDLAIALQSRTPGVVCETCAPSPTALILGNQLLLEHDPDYPAEAAQKYRVREHTVDAVVQAVQGLELPPAQWAECIPPGIATALDVFVGYVMLDAWVANQDRHHENWGAIQEGGTVRLAPTFDHGASLARNISDQERKERMETRDRNRQVPEFARKARSAFFADASSGRPMTTMAAWQALANKEPKAAGLWMERLRSIDDDRINAVLADVPPSRMSHVCREFTLKLLFENRRRILVGDSE